MNWKKKLPSKPFKSENTRKLRKQMRKSKEEPKSPTRVSLRIAGLNSQRTTHVARTADAITRSKTRRPPDPRNFALGYKAPKIGDARKASIAKEKERKDRKWAILNEKMSFFNDLQEVDRLFLSPKSKNYIDLFSDDEWHFVDKSEKIPNSITGEERHEKNVYIKYMYSNCQRSKKKAEDIVKEVIKPLYTAAETQEEKAKKKLENLIAKHGDRKNHLVDKAREEFYQAFVNRELLYQEMTGQQLFLPYDSIIAIQRLPSKYVEGDFDYFALVKNPKGGGHCKKYVSKEWLYDNVDAEFMAKLDQLHETMGWVTADEDVAKLKIYQDPEHLNDALTRYAIQPIYEYKPLRSDDQILVVKCEIRYDRYALYCKPLKYKWSVLTLKETYSPNPTKIRDLPKDPLELGESGERLYKSKYNEISKGLLCSVIGVEMVYLLECACAKIADSERAKPYQLSEAPEFKFSDEFESTNTKEPSEKKLKESDSKSKVSLKGPNLRMYDVKDLNDDDSVVFPLNNIGDFSVPQVYYFDMREFTTKYYIHTDRTQICGLYFDAAQNKFFGLTKTVINKKIHVRHVVLEDDWTEANFHEEFLNLVKQKSRRDQKKFIKLPIGKAKPLSSPTCNLNNPEIRYLQNGKDNCVFASIASALSYMGYSTISTLIWKYESEFTKTQFQKNTYGSVVQILHDKIGSYNIKDFNQNYQLRRITEPDKFNLVEMGKLNPNILYHVVLVGSDGSENHCVCVFDNFIFDGNYTHAWILEQESLNECIDSTFVGISYGYMYIPYSK